MGDVWGSDERFFLGIHNRDSGFIAGNPNRIECVAGQFRGRTCVFLLGASKLIDNM